MIVGHFGENLLFSATRPHDTFGRVVRDVHSHKYALSLPPVLHDVITRGHLAAHFNVTYLRL